MTTQHVQSIWQGPDGTEYPKDAVFYNVWDAPISLHGMVPEARAAKKFTRLPDHVLPHINEEAQRQAVRPTGIRARVLTDSPYIAVCAKLEAWTLHNSYNHRCSSGFDIYVGGPGQRKFFGVTVMPPIEGEHRMACGVASRHNPGSLYEYTVYFPNDTRPEEVHIGVKEGCRICEPPPYTYPKPVVFYGPSITQGSTALRAGNSAVSLLGRWLNFDYINMGLSGSCWAEDAIAEYLAKLDMSVLVYDYDHNAPSPEFLMKTHEKLFKTVRAAQPDLPIIITPRPETSPDYFYIGDVARRRSIVFRTYENAIKDGDKRVWYVDGVDQLAGGDADSCSIDGSHLNDLGYYRLAKALERPMRRALACSVNPGCEVGDID